MATGETIQKYFQILYRLLSHKIKVFSRVINLKTKTDQKKMKADF